MQFVTDKSQKYILSGQLKKSSG